MPVIEASAVVAWGNSVVCLARVVGADQTPITVDSVSSVEINVVRRSNGEIVVDEDPDPGDVFFDDLQTDYGWTVDAIGYNFRYIVNGDNLQHYAETFDMKACARDQSTPTIPTRWTQTFSTQAES